MTKLLTEVAASGADSASSVPATPHSNESHPPAGTGAGHGTIEPELRHPAPRSVHYNRNCLRRDPFLWQCLLLLPLFLILSTRVDLICFYKGMPASQVVAVWCTYLGMLASFLAVWVPVFHDWYVVRRGFVARAKIIEANVQRQVGASGSLEAIEAISTAAAADRYGYPSAYQPEFHHIGSGLVVTHETHKCVVVLEYPRAQHGKVSTVRTTMRLSDEQFRTISDKEEVTVIYLPSTPARIYNFCYFRAVGHRIH